jgi:N-acetyl-anhydromuramyl-L-alanine amidase AmpD
MITALKTWLASRSRKRPTTTIVLHATDGASASSSIAWLREIGLSYHYVIERDGEITKAVPVSRVAYHAGKSMGPDGPNVNDYSIGISFANFESRRESLTAAQVNACKNLVQELAVSDPHLNWLTTHAVISPGRKTDPRMLSRENLTAIALASGLMVWRPVVKP